MGSAEMMWYVLLAANLAISLETAHTNKEETQLWACRRARQFLSFLQQLLKHQQAPIMR